MGTFAQTRYTRISDYLAKLRCERFGEEDSGGRTYPLGPRWMFNDADAFNLMSTSTRGYYEARENTSEHCIVVGHNYGEAVVVNVERHPTKVQALRYAFVRTAAINARGRLQKHIDEIGGRHVYQQAVLRPGLTPRHDWLAWLNKEIETNTVYRGVYPEEMHKRLAALGIRALQASDVPALEWTDQLALALLRDDGAILHSKYGRPEIGSLDDAGGIYWILIPEVPGD